MRLADLGRWLAPVPRAAWVGGAVAVLLLAAQTAVVVSVVGRTPGPAALDMPVLHWFVAHRDDVATGFAIVLSAVGGPTPMTVLAVVTIGVLLYLRQRTRAAVVAAVALGSVALVDGFKDLYRRHRPPRLDQVIHYHGYSLPSGHALGSTVVLGVVAAVLVLNMRGGTGRSAPVITAAGLAVLIGLSRVYLAAHWLTDVLTGWLLGGAWLALGVTALVVLPAQRAAPGADPVAAKR